MSSLVTAPRRAAGPDRVTASLRSRSRRVSIDLLVGLGVTTALVVVAYVASGGVDLAPNTWIQVGLTVLAAAAAIAVMLIGAPGRPWGVVSVVLFGALAALTYASIAWSVQPANSWLEANRTLSYVAAFGSAVALARLAPERWRAVAGGIGGAAALLSAYALVVKVFPAALDPNDTLGRLRAPFDYWNAVGVIAAMGIPACLWAGARRDHAPVLRALSAPAIAIFLPALLLSYSRGGLIVAVIGTACWFALVPLRLRGALILLVGAAAGAVISAWALGTHSITADYVSLAARASAGHAFGLVLLIVLAATTAGGFGAVFAMDWLALSPVIRRRIGTVLVALTALIPVGGVAALATSSRGLTGEVSHVWTTLTSTRGFVTDQPGRLVALSNSRPLYWREGLTIGEHHLLAGVGALGFATANTQTSAGASYGSAQHAHVEHAHSYLIETFADFGLIGVAVSLGLLGAWAVAAGRPFGFEWRRTPIKRGPPEGDGGPGNAVRLSERAGLLTLFAVVLTFGLHSLIDWTWFIPGAAVPALVCAGWLAGRGPLASPVGRAARRRRLTRAPGAALWIASIAVLAVVAIWFIVQPLRSSDAYGAAVTAATRGQTALALTDAREAAADDPVSVDPLFLLSAIYTALGQHGAARSELVKAASLQPSNPATWARLGCYDLGRHSSAASGELRRTLALEPGVTQIRSDPSGFCVGM